MEVSDEILAVSRKKGNVSLVSWGCWCLVLIKKGLLIELHMWTSVDCTDVGAVNLPLKLAMNSMNVISRCVDDSITADEIDVQIKRLKVGKVYGPHAISWGILKLLPLNCIIILKASMFNSILISSCDTLSWNKTRLLN